MLFRELAVLELVTDVIAVNTDHYAINNNNDLLEITKSQENRVWSLSVLDIGEVGAWDRHPHNLQLVSEVCDSRPGSALNPIISLPPGAVIKNV